MKVLIFAGGRGSEKLLKSLDKNGFDITIVLNAYDDGHSTGILREVFDILGPSDCRKNCEHLLPINTSEYIKNLFKLRFPVNCQIDDLQQNLDSTMAELVNQQGKNVSCPVDYNGIIQKCKSIKSWLEKNKDVKSISDCSFMNLIFAACILDEGSFQKGTNTFKRLFSIKHKIIVNSDDNLYLMAITASGHFLSNESSIVEGRSSVVIRNLYLIKGCDKNYVAKLVLETNDLYKRISILEAYNQSPSLNEDLKAHLSDADIIIYSSGTLNSSLLPTYLTSGIADVIANAKAKKMQIVNVGADYETPTFRASDFVKQTVNFLNCQRNRKTSYRPIELINTVYVNVPEYVLTNHVMFDHLESIFKELKVISGNFEDKEKFGTHSQEFFDNLISSFMVEEH